jgi:hypothetical protein
MSRRIFGKRKVQLVCKLGQSKVRTADLVFYSKPETSSIKIPWARESPSLILAGIFLHASAKEVQETIPSIAFRLLSPGGRVTVWAEGHTPGEHSEAVEWAKVNGIPFSEQLISDSKEVSGFIRRNKVERTIPVLTTTHESPDTLRKIFELYDSWILGYSDFLLLGVDASVDLSKSHLQGLSASEGQISRELLEVCTFLIDTAEEHGAYILSQKISREEIERASRGILSDHGWQLVVKES